MILHVLSFRNKGIKAFSAPHYVDIEPEKCVVQLSRAIGLCSPADRAKYKRLALYDLGTFDDESGRFDLHEPEFLLDCDEIPVIPEPEQVEVEVKGVQKDVSC